MFGAKGHCCVELVSMSFSDNKLTIFTTAMPPLVFPLILLLFFLLLFLAMILSTVVHELGHAIPLLLFTRRKVCIYLGSYGNTKRGFWVRLGRLNIWMCYNLLRWRKGMCISEEGELPGNVALLYTVSGPTASVIVGAFASFMVFSYDAHGAVKLFFVVFDAFAIFQLFVNLKPNTQITLDDGNVIGSDGTQFSNLFAVMTLPRRLALAIKAFNEKKFEEIAPLLDEVMKKRHRNVRTYKLAFYLYAETGAFDKAEEVYEILKTRSKPEAVEDAIYAYILLKKGRYNESLKYYNELIDNDPDNTGYLNNRGFLLSLIGEYQQSIADLDEAIEIQPDLAYALNNRGYAKIKEGRLQDGFEDVMSSLKFNNNNGWAYQTLGIYYIKKEEPGNALEQFQKAKELEPGLKDIDKRIAEAKAAITEGPDCRDIVQ